MNNVFTPDGLTVWGSRQINIGNYENRSLGISVSKKKNEKEKTVEVHTSIKIEEVCEDSLIDAIDLVNDMLDEEETRIRVVTDRFTDYDSLEKIPNEIARKEAIESRAIREEEERGRRMLFNKEQEDKPRGRGRKAFLDD